MWCLLTACIVLMVKYDYLAGLLPSWTAEEQAEQVIFSKHSTADLCMAHHKKFGSFHIRFIGQIPCDSVGSLDNDKYAVRALDRMRFVPHPRVDDLCLAVTEHQPMIGVSCTNVMNLLENK